MGMQNDIINDRIDVVAKGFLGLTVTCARCHDHKFDPIPQKDYYSLRGIFDSCVEPKIEPVIGKIPNTPDYFAYYRQREQLAKNEETIKPACRNFAKIATAKVIKTAQKDLRQAEHAITELELTNAAHRCARWFWKTLHVDMIHRSSSAARPATKARRCRGVFCNCCPGRCGRFSPTAAGGWNSRWELPAGIIRLPHA